MRDQIVDRIEVKRRAQQNLRAGRPFMTTGQFSRSQLIDIIDMEILELTWVLGSLLCDPDVTGDHRIEIGRDWLRVYRETS